MIEYGRDGRKVERRGVEDEATGGKGSRQLVRTTILLGIRQHQYAAVHCIPIFACKMNLYVCLHYSQSGTLLPTKVPSLSI
jgi:hypothetical protein